MRHLVLLSGGADSAAALMDAVEAGGRIHMLHVVFGHSCRKDIERRSAQSISRHVMANVAPGRSSYAEAMVTLPSYAHRDLLFLIGIAHNEAAMGAMLKDPFTDIWFGDGAIETNGSDYLEIDRKMFGIFDLMCDPSRHADLISNMPTIHSQSAAGMTKQQARNRIGETLWSMTWGCRMPANGKPCGKCFTCKERAETHATSKA